MSKKPEALEPYDLCLLSNLSPTLTGIENVVVYCGHNDDNSYRIKVSVGKAWGASRKVFTMGTQGTLQGRWFPVRGSEYKTESDVPVKLLRDVREFIELNHALLKEWHDYDGLEADVDRFVPRLQSRLRKADGEISDLSSAGKKKQI